MESKNVNLRVELHEALANHWIIDRPIALCGCDDDVVFLFEAAIASGGTCAAFKSKSAVCNLPTVVDATDDIVLRATRVGEENLAELCGAVGLHDSSYFNTWLVHRHE